MKRGHYLDDHFPAVLSQIAAFSTHIDRTTETERVIILGIEHGDFSLADRNAENYSHRVAHEPTL